MATPKKISEYTPETTIDGTEIIPYAKAGVNGTVTLSTVLGRKQGKTAITIGKVGSGADYECDGIDDQVQFNAAMVAAAAGTNGAPANIEVVGYGYAFQYSINGVITILPTVGGPGVHIYGQNAVLKLANGYSGDMFITQNFYTEINSNYNSYSTIGDFRMTGLTLEGNSGGGTLKTTTYANLAAFPGTGVTGKLYVARDTDLGYSWTGSAYSTAGIVDSGKHWRAYAYHLIKMYAFHSVLEDVYIRDAAEFAVYSEQTNTDTDVFNNYSTMETIWRHISIVGYNLGAINWLGPHDGHWYDVGPHTNSFSTSTVLYNVYIGAGANYNGGGLVVHNFHPWGNTASYGANVVLDHASIRGDAYIEGSSNVGLRANTSTMSLDLVTTNAGVGIELTNCYNVYLNIDNYYQFISLVTMIKLIGTLTGSQLYVKNVDNNNLSGTPTIFDISGLTTATANLFWARIPYTTPAIAVGLTATSLDSSNEIDIIKAGATAAATTVIKRIKATPARVFSVATTTTLTPETNASDLFTITALATALNIANQATTVPNDGDRMRIRLLDNGTARALTYGTNYVAKAGINLPTTTVATKNTELTFEYNANLTKWNLLAVAQEA